MKGGANARIGSSVTAQNGAIADAGRARLWV